MGDANREFHGASSGGRGFTEWEEKVTSKLKVDIVTPVNEALGGMESDKALAVSVDRSMAMIKLLDSSAPQERAERIVYEIMAGQYPEEYQVWDSCAIRKPGPNAHQPDYYGSLGDICDYLRRELQERNDLFSSLELTGLNALPKAVVASVSDAQGAVVLPVDQGWLAFVATLGYEAS